MQNFKRNKFLIEEFKNDYQNNNKVKLTPSSVYLN